MNKTFQNQCESLYFKWILFLYLQHSSIAIFRVLLFLKFLIYVAKKMICCVIYNEQIKVLFIASFPPLATNFTVSWNHK